VKHETLCTLAVTNVNVEEGAVASWVWMAESDNE